jgi:hypothetical protein
MTALRFPIQPVSALPFRIRSDGGQHAVEGLAQPRMSPIAYTPPSEALGSRKPSSPRFGERPPKQDCVFASKFISSTRDERQPLVSLTTLGYKVAMPPPDAQPRWRASRPWLFS